MAFADYLLLYYYYYYYCIQIKLIIVTAASLGRIDRPFLAKGRGRKLDPLPMIHTCDLLAHEAHRHPFIESLGLVYLMKFRYTEDFCHRAGSAWRLIFIYALMPWLHKYRIHNEIKNEQGGDNNNNNKTEKMLWLLENGSSNNNMNNTTGGEQKSPVFYDDSMVEEQMKEISRLREILRANKLLDDED